MKLQIVTFAAAILMGATASANTLTEDFLDLVENICLPAIENAEAPDLSGLEPYDPDNPDHNFVGPTYPPGFVTEDPRLLIAYGERSDLRFCEVSFTVENPTSEGAAIVDALEPWIYDYVERTPYVLISNCGMFGFKMLISAGSPDRNPRGHFVRFLVHGIADPDDETRYGAPRFFVGETPEGSAEECVEDSAESG